MRERGGSEVVRMSVHDLAIGITPPQTDAWSSTASPPYVVKPMNASAPRPAPDRRLPRPVHPRSGRRRSGYAPALEKTWSCHRTHGRKNVACQNHGRALMRSCRRSWLTWVPASCCLLRRAVPSEECPAHGPCGLLSSICSAGRLVSCASTAQIEYRSRGERVFFGHDPCHHGRDLIHF
jgi:hypothetical protein